MNQEKEWEPAKRYYVLGRSHRLASDTLWVDHNILINLPQIYLVSTPEMLRSRRDIPVLLIDPFHEFHSRDLHHFEEMQKRRGIYSWTGKDFDYLRVLTRKPNTDS